MPRLSHSVPRSSKGIGQDTRLRKTRSEARLAEANMNNSCTVGTPHAPFHLPLKTKAIVSLVLFAAALSISRVHQAVRQYNAQVSNVTGGMYTGRGLRSRVYYWRLASEALHQHSYRRRVVFFDGIPWTVTEKSDRLGEKAPYEKRFRPAGYPLVLRPLSDSTTAEDALDVTRYYSIGDSKDFPGMERRQWPRHEFDPHCEPSAKWQSTFHPVCNEIHAGADLRQTLVDKDLSLLSSKGFWRHAWRHQVGGLNATTTVPSSTTVWKTFK
jgi:hypothetical protein